MIRSDDVSIRDVEETLKESREELLSFMGMSVRHGRESAGGVEDRPIQRPSPWLTT